MVTTRAAKEIMTFSDLFKLFRHNIKLIIAVPVLCAAIAVVFVWFLPPSYAAKAVLLTNGDVALASGFAQSEATRFSQEGIEVTTKTETSSRTITIEAKGNNYGGCIAAVNAAVLAAADDCLAANASVKTTTNEAYYAENTSPSIPRAALIAFVAGLILAIFFIVIIDMVKMPIKSQNDIETVSGLPIIGTIPNRDRGERLLANIRFLSDEIPKTIAVVPAGLSGASLTCAELASAFENAGFAVSRVQGSAHAQGIGTIAIPGIVSIIECAPLSEGVGAVYIAREADVALLCACEWVDTCKGLASVVDELKFAKANIGGTIFLAGKYGGKRVI